VARGRAIGDGHAAGGTWPGEVRDRDDATGEGTCQGEGTRPRNDAGQGGRAAREVAQAREGARGGGRKRERRRDGERRGGGGQAHLGSRRSRQPSIGSHLGKRRWKRGKLLHGKRK
jgi:hypothetical protein